MNFEAFGQDVQRGWIEIQGHRIHALSAGAGETVVLAAGWPQSLWAWRHVFPRLAKRYRVIALDLPGLGDSSMPAPAYDVNSVADLTHAAVQAMGVQSFHLVGHDLGAWVSYPWAARHGAALGKLVLMDAVIPGVVPMLPITPQNVHLGWHFGFNSIPDLPEALIAGRERIFLSWFFKYRALVRSAFTEADLDEYERVYRAPGAMASGLGYYRSMGPSAEQNRIHASTRLPMPVLVVVGDAGVGQRMIDAVLPLCERARGAVLKDCGHYIPEEAPDALVRVLMEFLG